MPKNKNKLQYSQLVIDKDSEMINQNYEMNRMKKALDPHASEKPMTYQAQGHTMFRHFEQYDTDLNTYMRGKRESLREFEHEELSDRSDQRSSSDEMQRQNSINQNLFKNKDEGQDGSLRTDSDGGGEEGY